MKNRRTISVVVIGTAVSVLALTSLIRWYRSGELPAGPDNFFNPREIERTRAHLDAHRLDLRPAIDLCDAVQEHLDQAEKVRFTNPDQAADALRTLATDLDQLAGAHRETLHEMEAGNPGTWQEPFTRLVETATQNYEDALRLCHSLSRQEWGDAGFPALLEQVISAKEITGRLQAEEMFGDAGELRTSLYPMFEQAYSDRNESDLARIRRRLLRSQPALTRWFYARLFQARHTFAPDGCPESLHAERDRLRELADELAAADLTGALASWSFPRGRAAHLDQLAAGTLPLGAAESVQDWLRVVTADASTWHGVIAATAPGSDTPDAEVRATAQWVLSTAQVIRRQVANLEAYPTLASAGMLASALERSVHSHQELTPCPARILLRAVAAHAALAAAQEALLELPLDGGMEFVEAASHLHAAAAEFARAVGASMDGGLVRDGLDQWLARQWPDLRELYRLTNDIRVLQRQGMVTLPAWVEGARLLDDIAASQTDAQRRALTATWHRGLADALSPFPRTSRLIEHSLDTLEQVTLREDLRDAIRLDEDERIRAIADRILATEEVPPNLRSAALTSRTLLDLPQHLHELDLDDPDGDSPILPQSPSPDSVVYPLFEKRVMPILHVARNLQRIGTRDCIDALAQASSALDDLDALYPHWHALDPLLEQAALDALPGCVAVDLHALRSLSQTILRLSARYPSLTDWNHYLTDLLALAETSPDHPTFPTRLEAAEAHRDRAPAADAYLASCRSLITFHRRTETVASFQRLRQDVSDLRNAPMAPPLASYAHRLLPRFSDGIDRLYPLVQRDIGTIRATDGVPSPDMLELGDRYAEAGRDETLPEPLRNYATAQAAALRHYAAPRDYILTPDPPGESPDRDLRIRYAVLSPDFSSLGFGRRTRGRGKNLRLWIRSGDGKAVVATADWKDRTDDGYIELRDVESTEAAFSWQWGHPVELGMTVAHTQIDNRDLIPDKEDERSRLNPLNYAVYRVETNHYPIVVYPNLEALARGLILHIREDGTPVIQLDRLLDPEQSSEELPALTFTLGGLPPGRDLDWPTFLPPPTASDARALGRDVRRAASNLFEQVLGGP